MALNENDAYLNLMPHLGGKFLMVSHGGSEDRDDEAGKSAYSRMELLKDDTCEFKWGIEVVSVPKPDLARHQHHKVYICTVWG